MLDWLVILDPIEGLKSQTDTSLAIINQARSRGTTVHTATIEQLFFEVKKYIYVYNRNIFHRNIHLLHAYPHKHMKVLYQFFQDSLGDRRYQQKYNQLIFLYCLLRNYPNPLFVP